MNPNQTIEFHILGEPAPGGSKRYVGHRKGKPLLVDDCKRNGKWRDMVALLAKNHMQKNPDLKMFEGVPLEVQFTFYVRRPKSHFKTNVSYGLLRDDAPDFPVVKPDVLKLARSTEDALTGIAWDDDARVVSELISKRYVALNQQSGVSIRIRKQQWLGNGYFI